MTDKLLLIKVAEGIYESSPEYEEKLNELAEILVEAIIYDHRKQHGQAGDDYIPFGVAQ